MNKPLIPLLALICLLGSVSRAQTFSSGSTGADGVLDLTSGDRQVQLPDSGILNYVSVNIPAGRTLTFKSNFGNTPVTILSQGQVTIGGNVNVSASPFVAPGPGGFFGGGGVGQPGYGPGGGQTPGQAGTWAGPLSLVPIIGGSGGAGGGCNNPAGSGGGAIAIASSTSINVAGTIDARGSSSYCGDVLFPGRGSDGAVRLVANNINVSGNISAAIARLEGTHGNVTYTGSGVAPVISAINPVIVASTPPTLSIVSIGGFAVPAYSGSSLLTIDLMLPIALADPISVVVQASNVPVGSTVTVTFNGGTGAASTSATLSGSLSSSSATVTISGLNRSAITYLMVSATFVPPGGSAVQPASRDVVASAGRDTVANVRLDSYVGRKPQWTFLRKDGSEIARDKIPTALLRQLGE